ncbi:MAG: hypothetical protein K2K70_07075 [Lachnospiraceae bacterium]|nr:hypothetical protein [Lachnospiraceae bacterium]
MKDSKILAFAFGVISMTLLHYFYWGWLADELMNGTSVGLYTFMFLPGFLTLVYCVFEKFVLYTYVCPDGKFLDIIPSTVVWVVECLIGAFSSAQTINNQWHDPEFGPGLETGMCGFCGLEMIISIVYFHLLFYVKNKTLKKVLLVMLALFLLQVAISAVMNYGY